MNNLEGEQKQGFSRVMTRPADHVGRFSRRRGSSVGSRSWEVFGISWDGSRRVGWEHRRTFKSRVGTGRVGAQEDSKSRGSGWVTLFLFFLFFSFPFLASSSCLVFSCFSCLFLFFPFLFRSFSVSLSSLFSPFLYLLFFSLFLFSS